MVASKLAARRRGHGKGVVGNGPQRVRIRLSARTKRWNWPLSWTSFSQDQGNAPTACAKGGAGLLASLSEVGKRKFRLTAVQWRLDSLPKMKKNERGAV